MRANMDDLNMNELVTTQNRAMNSFSPFQSEGAIVTKKKKRIGDILKCKNNSLL